MPETELLYHVRRDDSVVGSVDRDHAHIASILHRAGIVFLVRSDGKVLIQYRSPRKIIFPDRFDSSVAFHVTYGESYEGAATRELREETGVSAPVRYLGKFPHQDPPENQIVAVFVSKSTSPVTMDPEEATDAQFYSKHKVDDIVASGKVTPWLRDGWKLARDRI